MPCRLDVQAAVGITYERRTCRQLRTNNRADRHFWAWTTSREPQEHRFEAVCGEVGADDNDTWLYANWIPTDDRCGDRDQAFQLITAPQRFVSCDVNLDGLVDLSDAVAKLGYLYPGTFTLNCEVAGDCNDDGKIDLADVVFLLNGMFRGGPPCSPPTPDMLGCDSFAICPQFAKLALRSTDRRSQSESRICR